MPDMITVQQVAQQLNIRSSVVYEHARSGKLVCYRFGSAIRFDPADVEAYKASCRSVAPPAGPLITPRTEAKPGVCGGELLALFRAAGIKPRLTPLMACPGKSTGQPEQKRKAG